MTQEENSIQNIPEAEEPEATTPEATEPEATEPEATESAQKEAGRKRPKMNNKKKLLLLLIEGMLVAVFVMLLIILRYGYNSGNVEHYHDPGDAPAVHAGDGILRFNSVSTSVSKEGGTYAVGYDQASDDEEYPSVPSSASVYYTGEDGTMLYEVILYRDRVMPKATDHDTYTLDDWFAEWAPASEGDTVQEAYNTPQTSGFLIRGNNNCSYTYYFAVETESSIEQYVLELDYYDDSTASQAEELFKGISDSLTVKRASV